jgi:hypothetical protein
VKPKTTGRLRLHFPGGPGERASASRSAVLRVRARVSLSKPPLLRGSVAPVKKRVYVVLQVLQGGVWRKVATKAVKATRKGRFATTLRPPGKGSYRYYASTKTDRFNDRGRSPLVPFTR